MIFFGFNLCEHIKAKIKLMIMTRSFNDNILIQNYHLAWFPNHISRSICCKYWECNITGQVRMY